MGLDITSYLLVSTPFEAHDLLSCAKLSLTFCLCHSAVLHSVVDSVETAPSEAATESV